MNCQNCGTGLNDDTATCPSCGTAIKQPLSRKISLSVDKAIGPEGFGPINAKLVRFNNAVGVAVMIFILAIEIGLFTFAVLHGVPIFVPFIFIVPTLLMMYVTLRANKKIKKIDFSNPKQNYEHQLETSYARNSVKARPGTTLFGDSKIVLQAGESIITYLTPIYRFQASFSGPSEVSVERFTENVITVTNQRVLFFTVPLAGQGMLIDGSSTDMWNDTLNRHTIKNMVSEKMDDLTSGKEIEHFPNDFWIDRSSLVQVLYLKGIGPVKYVYAGALGFRGEGGKKLKYWVVDPTNFDQLIQELNAKKRLAF